MKNIVFKILSITSLTLFAVLLNSCESKGGKEDSASNKIKLEQQIIRPVIVIKPRYKNKQSNKTFNAISIAHEEIKLSFKVKGNIKVFNLNIGDFVKKNTIIAVLDKDLYQIEYKKASFALLEAKVTLKNAKSSYSRVKKLYINQNSSQSDLDNAKAKYYSVKARVANYVENLELVKLKLSYTTLYAPKSGFVAFKYVQKDENINIGSPIVLLSDENVLDVSSQIPENFINSINKEEEVSLSFDSLKDEVFKAKISEISKTASLTFKTFEVRAKLIKSDKRIKVGMVASMKFYSKNKENNILEVPSDSVLNDDKGYFVYLAHPTNNSLAKIKRADIEVGKLTSSGYEVLKGLKKDDLVLKAGMSQVFEDLIVELR